MKKLTLSKAILLVSLYPLSAFCLTPVSGWYAGANYGKVRINNANYASNATYDKNSYTYNLDLGYKFSPYLALEAGYTNFSDLTAKVNQTKVATTKLSAYDIAIKPILPVTYISGLELFTKIGVARTQSKTTNNDDSYTSTHGITVKTGHYNANSWLYGLGTSYYFMPHLSADLQWFRIKGNGTTGRTNYVAIGVTYLI